MTDQPHFPKWWTAAQKQLLEQLRADGVDWLEVARQCGHTVGSCRTTLSNILARRVVRAEDTPANPKAPRKPWTETELARLIELREVEGLSFGKIDRLLNRANGSTFLKYEMLRRDKNPQHTAEASERVRISRQQEADRAARKEAENRQSPISCLLGEPPPGYSALDQKRNGAQR